MTDRDPNGSEHLDDQLVSQPRLPLFVPVIAVLKVIEGLGNPARLPVHKPKR